MIDIVNLDGKIDTIIIQTTFIYVLFTFNVNCHINMYSIMQMTKVFFIKVKIIITFRAEGCTLSSQSYGQIVPMLYTLILSIYIQIYKSTISLIIILNIIKYIKSSIEVF